MLVSFPFQRPSPFPTESRFAPHVTGFIITKCKPVYSPVGSYISGLGSAEQLAGHRGFHSVCVWAAAAAATT